MIEEYGIDAERGNPSTSRYEHIRTVWERGLDVLRPTPAQLQHGLELHGQSLVIETFGFLPTLWNQQVAQKRDALIDAGVTGNEFHFRSGIDRILAPTCDAASAHEFLEALWCSGITGMIHTAAEGKSREEDIKRIATATHLCGWFGDRVRQLRRPEDLRQAHECGTICVGLSVNGPPAPGHLIELDDETRWLEAWYQLGVRMMHLSYNRRNVIATGCAERHDGGLSELGYEFVREMNRVGLIVDVPHSSEDTCIQAAEASDKPIMASHTGCKAVFDHMRNKSDQALKAIAQTDGLVGIVSRPSFLGPEASISTLLDHVDHAVKVIGVDHVAIGTDTGHVAPVPDNRRTPPAGSFSHRWWGAWWNQRTHVSTTSDDHRTGSLAWTNWPLLTVGLHMRGYPDQDIQKILGLNLMRVLEANSPGPASPANA